MIELTARQIEMLGHCKRLFEHDGKPPKHSELARLMGLGTERVRQIRSKLCRRFRLGQRLYPPGLVPDRWRDFCPPPQRSVDDEPEPVLTGRDVLYLAECCRLIEVAAKRKPARDWLWPPKKPRKPRLRPGQAGYTKRWDQIDRHNKPFWMRSSTGFFGPPSLVQIEAAKAEARRRRLMAIRAEWKEKQRKARLDRAEAKRIDEMLGGETIMGRLEAHLFPPKDPNQ